MLYKWLREYIKKYSFIKDTKFTGATLHIYYDHDGKEKIKRLPYRTTKTQLIRAIDSIKDEIGFEEDKLQRIKSGQYDTKNDSPPIFIII